MEIYKIITEIPVYEVSNYGNVRRVGSSTNLKIDIRNGYPSVHLYMRNKQYVKYIHRILAQTFIHNPNEYPQVNHIDGDKTNNHISNLEWVTRSRNLQHAWDTNLRTFTEKARLAVKKINAKEVLDIETGIFYDSLIEGCIAINENYSALRKRIMRKSKNVRFVYI